MNFLVNSTEKKIRLAILASGSGSNASALMNYFKDHSQIEVSCLISNKKEAPVLKKALEQQVPHFCVRHFANKSSQEFEEKMLMVLSEFKPDFIILAGFMKILSSHFLRAYEKRVINIHPSLLPLFPGKDGYGDAFRAKVTESGFTVHLVDEGVDTGPIISQVKCSLYADDSLESFKARGLKNENEFFPQIVEKYILESRGCL